MSHSMCVVHCFQRAACLCLIQPKFSIGFSSEKMLLLGKTCDFQTSRDTENKMNITILEGRGGDGLKELWGSLSKLCEIPISSRMFCLPICSSDYNLRLSACPPDLPRSSRSIPSSPRISQGFPALSKDPQSLPRSRKPPRASQGLPKTAKAIWVTLAPSKKFQVWFLLLFVCFVC